MAGAPPSASTGASTASRSDTAGHGPTRGGASTSFDRLLEAFATVMREAGDAAQSAAEKGARALSDAVPGPPGAPLSASGPPGGCATLRLAVHNTGNVALKDVRFEATNLIAGITAPDDTTGFSSITRSNISFTPESIERIRPRDNAETTVSVSIPTDAAQGVYRGLLFAHPGAACVHVAITVVPGRDHEYARTGTAADTTESPPTATLDA